MTMTTWDEPHTREPTTSRMDALALSLARLAAGAPLGLRGLVRTLPVQPPSFVLARALDRWFLPRLDEATRTALSGRVVELEVQDLGLRARLLLGARGFEVASSAPALTIRGGAQALWRLVRGHDDADRLFFERALVMEGDTEFGLLLKNTLDARGPLGGPWIPR